MSKKLASLSTFPKNIVLAVGVIFFIVVALDLLFLVSKSRSFQFFGEIIPRVETTKKVVALTFDDAPSPYSDQVLAVLAEKKVSATFYVIGQNLEQYPTQGENIVRGGHELGNHSYTHQRMWVKSLPFVEDEIQKTNQLIRKAGYEGEITFRPPYSKKLFVLPWYLAQQDIKTIMFDVEAETDMPKIENSDEQTDFLVNYTVEKVRPGSIILFHPFCESCGSNRDAVGRIIDELHAKGYTFVLISELLKS